ncbi:hypothetical protein GCM10009837_67340 [Streptomyces durmitorensis]|uniref:Uncharacterized protein n=1 Tax=Streptomyces durmitorensis TaxID=319947 RepID=A0ABY4Q782_9ACTN|nr:hypothetical protein [Streptomyces durmitorensis]UQT61219.1 hypothetical protein M4V62_42525 [Streptomyces durmitorensis]
MLTGAAAAEARLCDCPPQDGRTPKPQQGFELTVVDFTRLPRVPSMFDPERGHQRRTLLFLLLHQFVEQMAELVRDGYDQTRGGGAVREVRRLGYG